VLQRTVDARYLGEAHEVNVPVGPGALDEQSLNAIIGRFHDIHELTFGYAYRGEQPVELVNLRILAVGSVHRPAPALAATNGRRGASGPYTERLVYLEEGFVDCPVYRRAELAAESSLDGPAIVEEFGSTTVVSPGWRLEVDGYGNNVLERLP
jgi:N-methylhydantoinase A